MSFSPQLNPGGDVGAKSIPWKPYVLRQNYLFGITPSWYRKKWVSEDSHLWFMVSLHCQKVKRKYLFQDSEVVAMSLPVFRIKNTRRKVNHCTEGNSLRIPFQKYFRNLQILPQYTIREKKVSKKKICMTVKLKMD